MSFMHIFATKEMSYGVFNFPALVPEVLEQQQRTSPWEQRSRIKKEHKYYT